MVIYEITAVISADLTEKYEKYMCERHIPELLATRRFVGARFARSMENRYRIQYEALNWTSLQEYLREDAPRLRADFEAHFGGAAEVSRENWEVLQIWSAEFQ